MTTYNVPAPVSGEIATAQGLAAYSLKAGTVTADSDNADLLASLAVSGLISEARAKNTKKIDEPAEAPADAEEEK